MVRPVLGLLHIGHRYDHRLLVSTDSSAYVLFHSLMSAHDCTTTTDGVLALPSLL